MDFWIKSIFLVFIVLELEPSYCSRFHRIRRNGHDGDVRHQNHFLPKSKQQRRRDVVAPMKNATALSSLSEDVPSFNNYGFDEMQIEMAKALYVNIRNELKKAVDMRLNSIVKQYENRMLDRQNPNNNNMNPNMNRQIPNNNNQNPPVHIGNNDLNNRYGPIKHPVPPVNPHESINAKYIQPNGPYPPPPPRHLQPPPQFGYPNHPQRQGGNQQQWQNQRPNPPPGHLHYPQQQQQQQNLQRQPYNQFPPQQQQQYRPPQG